MEFHSHDLSQTSQQPCKVVMWAESWAPGFNRELAANQPPPPALFPSNTKRSGFHQHTSEVSRLAPWPLVFLPQRSGEEFDLPGLCSRTCPQSLSSRVTRAGEACGENCVVCLDPQSSLASRFYVPSGGLGFCGLLCPYCPGRLEQLLMQRRPGLELGP